MSASNNAPAVRNLDTEPPRRLTSEQATQIAWVIWLVMLCLPLVVCLAMLALLFYQAGVVAHEGVGDVFFVICLLWLAIAVPLGFFLRRRYFRPWWSGGTVPPTDYLRGMCAIWVAPEIGGLIALTGCIVSGTVIPNLLPAGIAFLLFAPFWPSGSAMTSAIGDAEDDTFFREPR